MPFSAPTVEQLRSKLPEVTDVVSLKQGGFKAVYRAVIGGRVEALKLVHIPKTSDDEAGELFRKECLGRVTREIHVLADCASPLVTNDVSVLVKRPKPDAKSFRNIQVLLRNLRCLWR